LEFRACRKINAFSQVLFDLRMVLLISQQQSENNKQWKRT
jgi:hypothetical protein